MARTAALAIAGAAALAALLSPSASAHGAAPTVRLVAPAHASGHRVTVRLVLTGARNVGGFQALLRFDPRRAVLSAVSEGGHGATSLGPVDTPAGLELGAYGGAGASGTVQLARVTLTVKGSDRLPLALSAPLVVDTAGRPVPLRSSHPGARGTARTHRLDLTGDGQVSAADLTEVRLAWQDAHERGKSGCGVVSTRDVDGDGCVDVGDAERIAAHLSPPRAGLLAAADSPPLTLVVDSTADDPDATAGDGICATAAGACTLRAAITEADLHPGPDTIDFAIPGPGVHTIQVTSQLPTLNDRTGGTTIDGYSQPGAAPNTDPVVDNARLMVQIEGTGYTLAYYELVLQSPNNVVRGLALFNGRPIVMTGTQATGDLIAGDVVGTDVTATSAAPALVRDVSGVELSRGAAGNQVGGPDPADRNVISGNAFTGVYTTDPGTNDNVVQGNLIGLNPAGTNRVRNQRMGVDINLGSSDNLIGGTAAGDRNVLSGNAGAGVEVSHQTNTVGNQVIGNFIGTAVTGNAIPSWSHNSEQGVNVEDGPQNTLVSGNVIGANLFGGVSVDGPLTAGTQIAHNWIGVAPNGTAITNTTDGVEIANHASGVLVSANQIGNEPTGIQVDQTDSVSNTFTQNGIFGSSGQGIDLAPLGVLNPTAPCGSTTGANRSMDAPAITNAGTTDVVGSACPGATVEVFAADRPAGQSGSGKTFAGSAVAGATGSFDVPVSGLAAGQVVTATATDTLGDTSEFGTNVTVAPPVLPPGTVLGSDDFGRTVGGGWGSADVGGPWALSGNTSDFAVDGTSGKVTVGTVGVPGQHGALLPGGSFQDVELGGTVAIDRAPAGNNDYAFLVARHQANGTEYRLRVRIATTGVVYLQAASVAGTTETYVGNELNTHLALAPGAILHVHAQVVGANPTAIRMRAWLDGSTEPTTWPYSVTDATAALQTAGSAGLETRLASGSTSLGTVFSFDGFRELVASP